MLRVKIIVVQEGYMGAIIDFDGVEVEYVGILVSTGPGPYESLAAQDK